MEFHGILRQDAGGKLVIPPAAADIRRHPAVLLHVPGHRVDARRLPVDGHAHPDVVLIPGDAQPFGNIPVKMAPQIQIALPPGEVRPLQRLPVFAVRAVLPGKVQLHGFGQNGLGGAAHHPHKAHQRTQQHRRARSFFLGIHLLIPLSSRSVLICLQYTTEMGAKAIHSAKKSVLCIPFASICLL